MNHLSYPAQRKIKRSLSEQTENLTQQHRGGAMQITLEFLKEKNACHDGIAWFEKHIGTSGEYQAVWDALAADEATPIDWARWLLETAGKTNDVKVISGDLTGDRFYFSGEVRITGAAIVKFLLAGLGIKAGGGIKAGWGIEAGLGIKAGGGIEAGGGIKAGEGFGIFAGIRVKISAWNIYARIICKSKPQNLISGFWVEE